MHLETQNWYSLSLLIMNKIFLLICYMLRYVHGKCIPLQGELNTEETSNQTLSLSRNSSKNINITFSITFPTVECCPILYFRAVDNEIEPLFDLQNCFDSSKLVPNKHYVTLKENFSNCLVTNNGSMTTCSGTRAFSYLQPRYFFVMFGYECKENATIGLMFSGIQYKFCVDNVINSECDTLQHDDECDINESMRVIFPNVFGHRNQRDVNDNRRRFDVFIEHNEKCYKHIRRFLCDSLYSECMTTEQSQLMGNASVASLSPGTDQHVPYNIPCRKMCEDLFLGCSDPELAVAVDCENYPDGLPPFTECTYLEVKCTIPANISNGRVTKSGNSLNDSASYTCEEGFRLDGADTLYCLPSGNWNVQIPKCIPSNHVLTHYTNVIVGCVVTAVVLVSAAVTAVLCRRYWIRKTQGNEVTLEEGHRNVNRVFICCSSHNIDDARAFMGELESRHAQCEFFTYHDHFLPGERIVDCIERGVWEDSSAVIIFLTQDYLDSGWCLHEFEEAYRRHEEDEHYPLLIILHENTILQLQNVPVHMQRYLNDHIYLSLEDKHLWEKLTPALGQ